MKTSLLLISGIIGTAGAVAESAIQTLSSSNWDTVSNWSETREPGVADDAQIKADHVITVNTAGNQAGKLSISSAGAQVIVESGGSLEIVSGSGQNGAVTLAGNAVRATGLSLQGGVLNVGGNLSAAGGDTGVTNFVSISGASTLTADAALTIGASGKNGSSLLSISGNEADISVGAKLTLGANSILKWDVAADGSVSVIDLVGTFKTHDLGGLLEIDMTNLTANVGEIVLMTNSGNPFVDTFDTVSIIGAAYELNYTGGAGQDLSLVAVPEPALAGLVGAGCVLIWAIRRRVFRAKG